MNYEYKVSALSNMHDSEREIASEVRSTAEGTRTLRVMTWNIHSAVGYDGKRDLARIVDIARREEPDILALQEVGSRKHVPDASGDFAFLRQMLGNHLAESRLVTAPDGHYGHAIISRWPLSDIRLHDISYRRREPRAAIEAVAHTPFGPLHVVAAHLGLKLGERRHQAKLLADVARSASYPSVLLGDFNDWLWGGEVQKTLNNVFPGRSHLRTFPAFRPLLKLDRIYSQPADMLVRSWTNPSARKASDHLPVIAELKMPFCERE
ncbi:endonuclease/exonuclease/phosphatase family protein [Chelativorans sp. Marseille-P2723]|uniref:endonuclease/exonuclease/phosphatase family protein n=1 Tax=Chelativorans sp. Marseille-P2723 TaxID=2709133 RepID=UPI001FEECE80|nr:endonuclease/exonuclease/phosphatase family protein [Chelativorans sp. Marseille-P2723]